MINSPGMNHAEAMYILKMLYVVTKQFLMIKERGLLDRLFDLSNPQVKEIVKKCDEHLTHKRLEVLAQIAKGQYDGDWDSDELFAITNNVVPLLFEIWEVIYERPLDEGTRNILRELVTRISMEALFASMTRKLSAREFIETYYSDIVEALKTSRNKKKTLAQLAKNHAHDFDPAHLLREFNRLHLKRERKQQKGAKKTTTHQRSRNP